MKVINDLTNDLINNLIKDLIQLRDGGVVRKLEYIRAMRSNTNEVIEEGSGRKCESVPFIAYDRFSSPVAAAFQQPFSPDAAPVAAPRFAYVRSLGTEATRAW